jgi:hypothetical protein
MVSHNNSRAKLRQQLKMKYKKWSDAEGNVIKESLKNEIKKYEARFTSTPVPVSVVDDFQAQAVDALRIRYNTQYLSF